MSKKSRIPFYIWLGIAALILVMVIFARSLAPYNPNATDLRGIFDPPSVSHWLGKDHMGRDVFSRLLVGGQTTLLVASMSTLVSAVVGILFGALSGFIGGRLDRFLMNLLEILIAIPSLLFILVFQAVFPTGVWGLTLLIGLTSWYTTARIIRTEVLRMKEKEFVKVAHLMGTPWWVILTQHLLLNAIPSIFSVTLLNFSSAIFTEVSLSFLGIGIPMHMASWGNMLHFAQRDLLSGAWWVGLYPGLMIVITVLDVNYLANHWAQVEKGSVQHVDH